MLHRTVRLTRKAFTLVELLVVIGIIALLISILMPSLARARDAALSVSCASNLRQVGQSLMMYADANKGKLPYSQAKYGTGNEIDNWWIAVSRTMGVKPYAPGVAENGGTWLASNLTPALRDPGAWVDSAVVAAAWWRPGYQAHYNANARLMPDDYEGDPIGYPDNPISTPAATRSLSSVRDSASKAWIWDGPQLTGAWSNGNAIAYSLPMDGWGWWGHGFIDPPAGGVSREAQMATGPGNLTGAGDTAQNLLNKQYNKDSPGALDSFIRFRHSQQTMANIMFCDGHVESVGIGGIPRKMFCINR